jgi:hypothetical protein
MMPAPTHSHHIEHMFDNVPDRPTLGDTGGIPS